MVETLPADIAELIGRPLYPETAGLPRRDGLRMEHAGRH